MTSHSLFGHVYLFKGLSVDQMDAIAEIAKVETYMPGDEVFLQGSKATALYVVKYGSVRITQSSRQGDNIEVATLATGSHFGEMAFVDGEPRSATAKAVEKSEIVVIDYEKLKGILAKQTAIAVHVYKQLAHFLCGRLRVTTNDLSFVRERNLSHF